MPEVEGTRINSGKKTSFVKPEEFPTFAGNDYREAMATTPGILVSEEPQSPIINFGYRGLNSQRSEFTQVLKDGVSIKNEQFGFPESHYTPILDAVERIEVIRAGAALQFGCATRWGDQFRHEDAATRRAVSFHDHERVWQLWVLSELHSARRHAIGPVGFYLYYDHRQQDGFREANSDYDLNAGSARFVYDVTDDSRFILTLDFYDEEHGEPGGMRRREEVNPPNSVFVEDGFTQSSRFFDRFRLERDYATLEYQKFFSERTQLDIKAFGGYYDALEQAPAWRRVWYAFPADQIPRRTRSRRARPGQKVSMLGFVTITTCSATSQRLPAASISTTHCRTDGTNEVPRRTRKMADFGI